MISSLFKNSVTAQIFSFVLFNEAVITYFIFGFLDVFILKYVCRCSWLNLENIQKDPLVRRYCRDQIWLWYPSGNTIYHWFHFSFVGQLKFLEDTKRFPHLWVFLHFSYPFLGISSLRSLLPCLYSSPTRMEDPWISLPFLFCLLFLSQKSFY